MNVSFFPFLAAKTLLNQFGFFDSRSIDAVFRSAPQEFSQNQQHHSRLNSKYKYESLSNYSGKKHDVKTDLLVGKEDTFSAIKKLEAEAEVNSIRIPISSFWKPTKV